MKVKDAMKTDVGACSTEDNLMKAADVMRLRDCGVVPVLDDEKSVVGMLTDRDICLAIVARNRKASDVKTKDLLKNKAITCFADDDLESALRKMRKYQIKHLAVVDKDNKLVGMLTISDVILSVRKDKSLKKKIYSTVKAIAKPRPIVLREISENNAVTVEDMLAAARPN
jgi:CBS domain-containing protein